MPIFYHIHVKREQDLEDTLEKGFIKDVPLFMSKKNSRWYINYISMGTLSTGYTGGYSIWKITIPKELFTTSLHPKGENKILKITKRNIVDYKKMLKQYKGRNALINELTERHIIGIDVTSKFTYKHQALGGLIPLEAFIWQKPSQIKIKKIETVKYKI